MAKNDMEVIMYKILRYLYECMKLGVEPELEQFAWNSKLFDIPQSYLDTLNKETFSEWKEAVETLVRTANACGHPYQHPLSGISIAEYSSAIKEEAVQLLSTFIDLLSTIQPKLSVFPTLLKDTDMHPTRMDFQTTADIVRHSRTHSRIADSIFIERDSRRISRSVRSWQET